MKAPIPKCKKCGKFLWSTDITIAVAEGRHEDVRIKCSCGKKYKLVRGFIYV